MSRSTISTLVAFAAGVVTMSAAVAYAGNWTPTAALLFGFLLAYAVRARRTTVYQVPPAAKSSSPAARRPATPRPNQVELDLTSALMNLGSRKPAAAAAARYALAQLPGQTDIPTLVAIALRAPKAA
jgi:hypothetical protein